MNAIEEFIDYYKRRYKGKTPVLTDVIDSALLDFYLIGRKDEKRKLVDLVISSDILVPPTPAAPTSLDLAKQTGSNETKTKQQNETKY